MFAIKGKVILIFLLFEDETLINYNSDSNYFGSLDTS